MTRQARLADIKWIEPCADAAITAPADPRRREAADHPGGFRGRLHRNASRAACLGTAHSVHGRRGTGPEPGWRATAARRSSAGIQTGAIRVDNTGSSTTRAKRA